MHSNHVATSRIAAAAPSFGSPSSHPQDKTGQAVARLTCLWAREGTIKKCTTTPWSGTLASREGGPLSGLLGRLAVKWERHGPQLRDVSGFQKTENCTVYNILQMPNKSRTCVLFNHCRPTPYLNKFGSQFDSAATKPFLL